MSKHHDNVRLAYEKGYRVTGGKCFNPKGHEVGYIAEKVRFGHVDKRVMLSIAKSIKIRAHVLVAYQKYGEETFSEGMEVRHLNGDSLDNREENIAIGTKHQNAMDRKPIDRTIHAYKATAAIKLDGWGAVDRAREAGASYKDIEKHFGVCRSTLSYRYSLRAKRSKALNLSRLSAQLTTAPS